jgi:hypothetical protein
MTASPFHCSCAEALELGASFRLEKRNRKESNQILLKPDQVHRMGRAAVQEMCCL